jgi:hypothetical protein
MRKKSDSHGSSKFLINLLLLLSVSLFLMSSSYAQEDGLDHKKGGFQWNRIFFSGNLGNFRFGTETSLDISPSVGYRITDKFSAGVGITYQYYNNRIYHESTNIYGYRAFLSHAIYKSVFAYTEFENLSLESKYFDPLNVHQDKDRYWLPSLFIGAGYKMAISEKAFFYMMLLYNLNDSGESYYQNPVIRVGISL